jgi:hypothetical protein
MRVAPAQLTIDGREEHAESSPRHAALSRAQRAILRALADHDLTSTEAGQIVHAHRDPPCERCRRGSCGFTSTDGGDALKRLAARGLVRKVAPGIWTARP